jgi:hypothetical protein
LGLRPVCPQLGLGGRFRWTGGFPAQFSTEFAIFGL